MPLRIPEEIFDRPVDSQVASFIGFENMLNGRVISADRGLLRIEAGEIICMLRGISK